MKTINDLVNKLNNYYDMEFRVANTGDGYCIEDDMSIYICFDNGHWDILSGFCMLHHDVQKEIMDFIYTTDSNHWFDEQEKKYNIIIGEDVGQIYRSAYKKCGFGAKVSDNVHEEIMDFIYTTDSNHWFDEQEKKYNIIIGEDVGQIYRSAYKKCGFGAKVSDNVHEENLTLDDYQFTETEIEDLKSKVSERSAKIIDLGKVEIKDE